MSSTPRRNPPRRVRSSTSSPLHASHSPGASSRGRGVGYRLMQESGRDNATYSHDDGPTSESAEPDHSHDHAAASPVVSKFQKVPTADNFIEVSTNVQIFRLQKIDSSSEEYCLDVGLTFIWIDPNLVRMINGNHYSTHPSVVKHSHLKDVENVSRWPDDIHLGEDTFDPSWKILNSSDVNIVKSITTVLDASIGKVHNFVHVRATIDQSLDLHDFPFDRQKLLFRLQSEHPTTCMKFQKFDNRDPKIFAGDTSEWLFHHHTLPDIKLINSRTDAAASGVVYASITAELYALRKPEWYMWNVVFTSFAIVASSFSLFCLNDKGERLGLLFTTWLMLISLKFIISDRLPKISYFSLLDKYITLSYLIMVLLILHVCIGLPFLLDDSVVFIFFCVIWVAVHVLVMWKYHTSNDWEVWRNRINTLKSLKTH